ncbi:ABC transporter substrate-binding protein [Maribellus comscasis]|uniref:ABC transporter substrate-binding protein n=1 Tax=Maribellus comscasis TaxID=2681766 RepID=A0A6I6JQX4_9BACT|nr:ABC transporter substrate-binding protein [Maribellus comscasis]QGY42507.1 ABC transporter substrate-binding protein [Maribellus comscasis]
MQRFSIFILFILFLSSCVNDKTAQHNEVSSNEFAGGFSIGENSGIVKLSVFNPWEKAQNVKVEYFLVPKEISVPDSLQNKNIIRTPIQRIICMSTSHLGFIEVLSENNSVVGISGANYVSNPQILQYVESGKVVDVGYGQNLNYEMILNQHPDVVMLYGVGSEVTTHVKKLEELGIPVIMNAEYLEETPLGKVEWIKFVGALYQKENEAQQFFTQIKEDYLSLKEKVKDKQNKPKVLVGSPYKDSWWIPGGDSYLANMIKDAGGDYIGKDNDSHESYVISFENALTYGNEVDVWINMGLLSSRKDIIATDQRFKNFGVLKSGRLFNNNNKMSENGGNDFWESGTVYPNLILRDLISVFYPGTINEDLVYYKEVE